VVLGEVRGTSIRRVAALDGARGVAVAGVLLFHGGHLLGGYLGVDFFFTLSGFLITSLLLAESSRTGSVGLGSFWARRARRLLPALAVLLLGVAVYSWLVAAPEQMGQIRGDTVATLGYAANWHRIFSGQSYFALFTAPSPLDHTWSLAIEEQFYALWPLVFVGLLAWWKRAAPKAVLATSLALACGSSALMIALYRPGNVARAYYGTDTRATAILLGAALAAWLSIHGPTTSRVRRVALEAIGLAGAAVLAVAWMRLDGQSSTPYRGGFVLCGLAATAIIATAVHPEPGPVSRTLSLRPLCALGAISYGVYLYHWPIDVFLDRTRVGIGGWPLLAIQTAVTLAVAAASYRWIEQPVRHGALSSVQWRALTPAVAVTLVLIVFAATTTTGTTSAASTSTGFAVAAVGAPTKAAARAFRAAPAGSERVMVVGNSVAFRLGQSFEQLQTERHLSVFNAGLLGCSFPPAVQVPIVVMPNGSRWKDTPCDPVWERSVVRRFRPQVVFWIVTNPAGRGGTYLGHDVEPCSPAWDALYARSLRREVGVLAAAGATVVITTSAYSRYFGLHVNDRSTDCDNRIRRAVASETGAQLVDLFGYTCPQGQCRGQQNGVNLRPDGLHYQGPGGVIVARWLLDQVRPDLVSNDIWGARR
jgi:peptidoglycan/LPS O-acetylase OafA/YrhL